MKRIFLMLILSAMASSLKAERIEPIRYGNFDSWVTREISESGVIGGNDKTIYEIGPTQTIKGNKPYTPLGGSPWATSNVYAKVMGVVKGSNAVFPDDRPGHGKCAKLTTVLEHCKAIGLINIDVTVAGSIFLGRMFEPVKSTHDPYTKMEMGIPFTKRPKALSFDYKLTIPEGNQRLYSSGFGKKKTLPGHENAEVYILLQRRWEDADGNIHAKRVGTGCEVFKNSTNGWVNSHRIPVVYGEKGSSAMPLIPQADSYYARNSKGKMVPVIEEGWDTPDATPTHLLIMASAAEGEPYVGTIGLTMWVDNMGLVY
ncbi:MAG: PCMD domain-containing protein [Muribaculaceae bacterium]|nr:PCMD domain-containing protein [Muribaculaceae bacterium]